MSTHEEKTNYSSVNQVIMFFDNPSKKNNEIRIERAHQRIISVFSEIFKYSFLLIERVRYFYTHSLKASKILKNTKPR